MLEASGPFGSAGDLLVCEDVADGQIFQIVPDPTPATTTVLVGTAAALRRPEGMAFGDFGGALTEALYVAETSDDTFSGSSRTVRLVFLVRLPRLG